MEGFDDDDMRASADGPVSANMDYEEWLKTQPDDVQRDILGATRFELYKQGMPITSFVADGRMLTLDQLAEKEGLVLHSPQSVDELLKQTKEMELKAQETGEDEYLNHAREFRKLTDEALVLEEQTTRARDTEPTMITIRQQETEIRDSETEKAIVVDRYGNIKATFDSESKKTVKIIGSIEDMTVTHNHPAGKVHSPEDISNFIIGRADEFRVTTESGETYSIRRKEGFRAGHLLKDEYRKFYNSQITGDGELLEFAKNNRELYKTDEAQFDKLYSALYNEIMGNWLAKNAENFNCIYSVENRGGIHGQ